MKKLLALLLALAMMLTMLVGCGGDSGAIEGKWILEEDNDNYLEFQSGGKLIIGSAYGSQEAEYKVDGDELTLIREDGDQRTYDFEIDGDKLVIDEDGENLVLYREGKSSDEKPSKKNSAEGEWQHVEDDDEKLVIKNGKVNVYEDGEKIFTCSYEQNGDELILRYEGEEISGELDGDTLYIEDDEYERID